MPDRETTPIFPDCTISPGIIPILASPGVIKPGQFGPTTIVFEFLARLIISIVSTTGTPSVTMTNNSIPASIASKAASFVNFAGTKITEALAPVW